jgi:hypothetical protein
MYVGEVTRLLNRIANAIDDARDSRKASKRDQNLVIAVNASIEAVDLLLESEEFDQDLRAALSREDGGDRDRNRVLEDSGLFEAFLDVERRLLLAVGLAPNIVDPTIRRMRLMRPFVIEEHISKGESVAGADQLRELLQALREELRGASAALQESHSHRTVLRKLTGAVEGVTGLTVVGIDGAGAILSLGIGAAPAAVSGAFGATMAADGLRRCQDEG